MPNLHISYIFFTTCCRFCPISATKKISANARDFLVGQFTLLDWKEKEIDDKIKI